MSQLVNDTSNHTSIVVDSNQLSLQSSLELRQLLMSLQDKDAYSVIKSRDDLDHKQVKYTLVMNIASVAKLAYHRLVFDNRNDEHVITIPEDSPDSPPLHSCHCVVYDNHQVSLLVRVTVQQSH